MRPQVKIRLDFGHVRNALAAYRGPSLVVLAVALRVTATFASPNTLDIPNYEQVGRTLLSGGTLYVDTLGLYPYPPPWALWEMASVGLSSNVSFPWVIRVPILLADVYLVVLLTQIGGWKAGFFYAVNPVAVVICGYHGQFDAIPILCTLLSMRQYSAGRQDASAAFLAAGVTIKVFPVLLLPVYLARLPNWPQRVRFAAIVVGPTVTILLPFMLMDPGSAAREIMGYKGVLSHGLAVLVQIGTRLTGGNAVAILTACQAAFIVGYTGVVYRTTVARLSVPVSTGLVFACFYSLYPALSAQYLVWLLPYLGLCNRSVGTTYSLLGATAIVLEYGPTHFGLLTHLPAQFRVALWAGTSIAWWCVCSRWLVASLARNGGDENITPRDRETARA